MTVRQETARYNGPRESDLFFRAGLARLARKAGLVGSFIFLSRVRLACLAHNSQAIKARCSSGSALATEALMNDAGYSDENAPQR